MPVKPLEIKPYNGGIRASRSHEDVNRIQRKTPPVKVVTTGAKVPGKLSRPSALLPGSRTPSPKVKHGSAPNAGQATAKHSPQTEITPKTTPGWLKGTAVITQPLSPH